MRVFGVDPGLTRCGFGVVDGGTGRTVRPVAVDVVRTPADEDLSRRLLQLADAVEVWLDRYAPDVVAIERVFSQHNVRTAMGTAQAGGIVALAAARRGLPVEFHTPSEVKAAVTGSGRADKAQVTAMVTKVLGLKVAPRPADAADALALAICHLWRAPMKSRLEQAQARAAEIARTHRARLAGAAGGAGTRAGGAAQAAGAATRAAGAAGRAASTADRPDNAATRAGDPLITDKRATAARAATAGTAGARTTARTGAAQRTTPGGLPRAAAADRPAATRKTEPGPTTPLAAPSTAGQTTPPASAAGRARAARTAPAAERAAAPPVAAPPPVPAPQPADAESAAAPADLPPAALPPVTRPADLPPAAPLADLPPAALPADLPSDVPPAPPADHPSDVPPAPPADLPSAAPPALSADLPSAAAEPGGKSS
ncbi:Holliday junction endonuclease RuvC [Actinosynnema pretiosum]|nr:Holliday junction endonuclease RuvC [Actinosynnema pretiosum]